MIRRRDLWPLGAVGFILAVTVGWWSLALWSAPGAPEWLERTRSVCFNITESGLPDAKGWLLLLGQPPSMLAVLLIGWRGEVVDALGHLVSSALGRMLALATVMLALVGAGLAGWRVSSARLPEVAWGGAGPAAATYPRVDRPWPEAAGLVDQTGAAFTLEALEGRRALVTFAFGHCETLCPVVVHQARAARSQLDGDAALVVLTLDPWRDTPARLPALVSQWGLDPLRDFVVSGAVEDVQVALDQWDVTRERDTRTGDITHPGLVFLVEPWGTLAYVSTGGVDQLVSLGRRLGGEGAP